jgi:hypothetical protein
VRALTLVVLVCLTSCAPARHSTYSAQSRDNALDCALTYGVNTGYTPAAGGTNGGFIRLERRVHATIDFSGRELDVLTVTVSNGRLQVDATGLGSKGEELGASGQVKREASEILNRCGRRES